MTDYISKKSILKDLIGLPADLDAKTVQRCIEAVHNFPSADVRENKHGKWVYQEPNSGNKFRGAYWCNQCRNGVSYHKQNFCPNCGAKMDEENKP